MKTTYDLDPAHCTAQFVVRHVMITNVRGSFSNLHGSIAYDSGRPAETAIEAVIDAGTIRTGEDQRDAHLKSGDFLDIEHYPTITFKSTRVELAGDGELKVTGELAIHGVIRPVVLKVEGPTAETKDPFGNIRIGASATTKIKRSDFGLTWNAVLETGGFLVGDDLKIELEISAIKAAGE